MLLNPIRDNSIPGAYDGEDERYSRFPPAQPPLIDCSVTDERFGLCKLHFRQEHHYEVAGTQFILFTFRVTKVSLLACYISN